jgi:hypothetical protein
VGISFRGKPAAASDLMDGSPLPLTSTGAGDEHGLRFELQPGEIRLLSIDE